MISYNTAVRVRNIISVALFALVLSWVLSSCEQHDLCYNHDHMAKLNVTMDWRNDPDARPGSMYLFLYPEDSSKVLKRDFAGYQNFRTEILVGLGYDVVTINSDFKNDILRDTESKEDMTITTDEATTIRELAVQVSALPKTRASNGEEEMRTETDAVWSDHSSSKVLLSHDKYYAGEDVHLTLMPRPLFCNYHVIVRNVKNKNKIKGGIAASLSGLCEQRNVYTAERGPGAVTIPFAMLSGEGTQMQNTIKCFGRAMDEKVPNKLAFYASLKDGTKWSYVYDVTDQVKNAPDPRNVTIVIDLLTLPDNIGENSGIKPDVSKWEIIDIPLRM